MATWTQRTHLLLRSILFQLRASLWTLGWLWGRHLGLLGRATAEPERRKSFAKAASRNGFYCTANSQGQHGRNKITWLLSTNYRVTPCSTQTAQAKDRARDKVCTDYSTVKESPSTGTRVWGKSAATREDGTGVRS